MAASYLAEIGLHYYKARMYSPTLGRFMQTDPIGYGDGINWYNYVGSDPVNRVDPSGTIQLCTMVPITGDGSQTRSTYDGQSFVVNGYRSGYQCRDIDLGGATSATPPSPAPIAGGSAGNPASLQNNPPPCRPSPTDLKNSGGVTFRYSEFNVSALGTSGDAFGTFRTSKGYYGTFHTSFDGVFIGGKGVGVSYGGGSSQSLAEVARLV